MRNLVLLICLLTLPLAGMAEQKTAEANAANNGVAQVSVRTLDPRPFGYVIGDAMSRRIEIDTPASFKLAADSLPRPGRVDAWLELRKIELAQKAYGASVRHTLDLRYQILNSPQAVKTHYLPKLLIIINNNDNTQTVEINETPFTFAPITPAFVLARDGLEELRADKPAPLIDASAHYWRLGFAALATAAALLSLIYIQWGMPFLRRHNGPFARAHRDISRLNDADMPAAIRSVHRAFDQTAGVSIFRQHLPEFFLRHAAFADLREDAQRFYAASRGEFFSGRMPGDQAMDKKWLLDFCARCRDRERGLR